MAEEPNMYKPLYMLDDDGKVFESIVVIRYEEAMVCNTLSGSQYGFWRGRSDIYIGKK